MSVRNIFKENLISQKREKMHCVEDAYQNGNQYRDQDIEGVFLFKFLL